ncbi:MAG: hypothetical protein SCALA702_04730 [Melioribacteraceae bacterium]|nr:MAG: hypothetical protein SCALA702_04730 [Melioribacteraceae bacterium]
MNQKMAEEICKKCGGKVYSNFCPECGTPKKLKRIDGDYVLSEIVSVLNFDKGILYTIKELLKHPGNTVKEFISADRNRIVKPIIFIIISSLIYTLLRQFFQFEDGYIYHDDSKPTTAMYIFGWITDNYGYGNLIMGIFIAFWTKILFRKYKYNFYEILILLCFVMGMGMLILAVFGLLEGITDLKILQFGGMLFVLYASWAIGQFFDKRKFSSYVKAVSSYLLGMITFTIVIFLIAFLIDIVFNPNVIAALTHFQF